MRSYNGHYLGLSIRRREFDSPTHRQVDDLDIRLNALANVQSGVKPVSFKVRSYNGHYLGLSIRRREFDSPTHRQVYVHEPED